MNNRIRFLWIDLEIFIELFMCVKDFRVRLIRVGCKLIVNVRMM